MISFVVNYGAMFEESIRIISPSSPGDFQTPRCFYSRAWLLLLLHQLDTASFIMEYRAGVYGVVGSFKAWAWMTVGKTKVDEVLD